MNPTLKRLLVLIYMSGAVFLLAATSPQPKPAQQPPHERLQRMAERLRYDLKLTDEQYQKLLQLNEEHLQKLRQTRDELQHGQQDPEAQRERFLSLRAQHQQAIDALLTDQQRAQKAAFEASDFRARLGMQQARFAHTDAIVAEELQRLTQALLLSEEQQTKIEALLRQRTESQKQLVDAFLKQDMPDRETYRKEMSTLRKDFRTGLLAELNPAQREKAQHLAQEGMQNRRQHGPQHRQGHGPGHRQDFQHNQQPQGGDHHTPPPTPEEDEDY